MLIVLSILGAIVSYHVNELSGIMGFSCLAFVLLYDLINIISNDIHNNQPQDHDINPDDHYNN